jgi:RNA polymerase sigma-70 factor (ECF subfamily)
VEDEAIIELYFARDEKAITETVEKYGARCRKLGLRILGNPQDAEECCNDVWLRVWNTIPPQHPAHFGAYLVKLMRNAALNLYEKNHAEKRGGAQTAVLLDELAECLAAPDDVEAQITEAETGEMLRTFLRTVSDEAKNIFILRYVYMMPVKEIAETYRISVSKVKVSLYRTRRELRDYLGGEQL